MDGRFEARREELLAQACVSVKDWEAVVARSQAFVEPFVESLTGSAQRRHLVEYSSGLLSGLERKTGEGIAYLHGQDRKQMQQFVGESPSEHAPLLTELPRQVAARIGEADGGIVARGASHDHQVRGDRARHQLPRGRDQPPWRGDPHPTGLRRIRRAGRTTDQRIEELQIDNWAWFKSRWQRVAGGFSCPLSPGFVGERVRVRGLLRGCYPS